MFMSDGTGFGQGMSSPPPLQSNTPGFSVLTVLRRSDAHPRGPWRTRGLSHHRQLKLHETIVQVQRDRIDPRMRVQLPARLGRACLGRAIQHDCDPAGPGVPALGSGIYEYDNGSGLGKST